MRKHLVSVYLRGDVILHLQSTNGDVWLSDVLEIGSGGIEVPLRRVNVILEPTADEIAQGSDGRPLHRSASKLFNEELEFVRGIEGEDGKVVYRSGSPQFGEDIQEVGEVRDGRIAR